ncbi:DUF4023 domain-containing protein [Virgibacillus byunsanensis]|uniref:DUF4023 domain-containing protein n=1 Tax=Virgibacillus byunsanensis TaxID=570945 RepID=A0ABW3LQW6_9BACI
MEDTHEFVERFNENKKKSERNKKRQGKRNPAQKLPGKRH